jgi:hypothetical protein
MTSGLRRFDPPGAYLQPLITPAVEWVGSGDRALRNRIQWDNAATDVAPRSRQVRLVGRFDEINRYLSKRGIRAE